MPVFALTNAAIYGDSIDFTGISNQVTLTCEGTVLDRTNFRSGGWSESIMGAKTSTLTAAGQAEFSDEGQDEWQFTNLGTTGKVWTVAGQETESGIALMLKSMPANFGHGGNYNEIAPYTLNGVCSDGVGVVRGVLLKEYGTVSATGALGTAVELGAVSSTQSVYSTIHLMGTAGTSITVVVESAAADDFDGATTRITHGSHTTVGGRWGAAPGAITDTWWRARVTAISGTWTVAVAAGIQ